MQLNFLEKDKLKYIQFYLIFIIYIYIYIVKIFQLIFLYLVPNGINIIDGLTFSGMRDFT